jgi:hypothetical protein
VSQYFFGKNILQISIVLKRIKNLYYLYTSEISGFHDGEHEDDSLLGYSAMSSR